MPFSTHARPATGPGWRPHGWIRAGVLLLAVAAGLAAVPFEQLVVDRVVDGGFESGFVSLTLPADARFPLFASGWAARGRPVPAVVEDPTAPDGDRALELRGGGPDPVQVIQDLPLASPATALRLDFRPVQGTQILRLVTTWDRGSLSAAGLALELVIGPGGIDVRTPAGSWRLDERLTDGAWHRLEAIADPRSGLQTVTLDDRTTLSVPGIATLAPRTLLLEAPADRPSRFRWDGLGLAPLADLELQLLRSRAMLGLDADAARWLLPRLEAASTALARGRPELAAPELRAARDQLAGRSRPVVGELHEGLESLLELLALGRRVEDAPRR